MAAGLQKAKHDFFSESKFYSAWRSGGHILFLLCITAPMSDLTTSREDMRGEATATNSEGNGMGQGTGSRQGVRIASRNIWLGSEGEIGGKM